MSGSEKTVLQRFNFSSQRFSYLKRTLGMVLDAARTWTIIWFALLAFRGLLPAATVYLTKVLVDSLAFAVGNGLSWESIRPVLSPTLLIGGVLLSTQVLQGLIAWVRAAQSELVQDSIKSKIHTQAASVDLKFYEIPEESNRMARANMDSGTRSLSLLQNLGTLMQNIITLFAVAGLLLPYSYWLPGVLFLSTLPALWVVLHHNRLQHDWWEETTEDRRWVGYFDSVLTVPLMAPEVRLLALSEHFQKSYQALRKILREGRLRLMRSQSIAQFGAGLAALVVTAGAIAWMGMKAMSGQATLGDVALFYSAFSQGQNLMRSLLGGVGQLFTDTLFLEHLFHFLDLKAEIRGPEIPTPFPDNISDGISFNNVSFKYPGSEFPALSNLSLDIPAGKTVALVGPNGAGKSTITKLMCRFYDPTDGTITIDGIDIREFNVDAIREATTVMFQHPVRYTATLGENIAMGDLLKDSTPESIHTAAIGGGADTISLQLPDGYNSLLGKQFHEGNELSGGQWQRVALSRAFYRDVPIVILDEPTSFMDSWAETAWLDRFRDLIHGRTALIVTHRFTTAMRADIIHVMDRGQIVESGSHADLLEQQGSYAASWTAQTQIDAGKGQE